MEKFFKYWLRKYSTKIRTKSIFHNASRTHATSRELQEPQEFCELPRSPDAFHPLGLFRAWRRDGKRDSKLQWATEMLNRVDPAESCRTCSRTKKHAAITARLHNTKRGERRTQIFRIDAVIPRREGRFSNRRSSEHGVCTRDASPLFRLYVSWCNTTGREDKRRARRQRKSMAQKMRGGLAEKPHDYEKPARRALEESRRRAAPEDPREEAVRTGDHMATRDVTPWRNARTPLRTAQRRRLRGLARCLLGVRKHQFACADFSFFLVYLPRTTFWGPLDCSGCFSGSAIVV